MPQLITGASHAEAHLLKRILNQGDIILGDQVEFQIPGTEIYKLPSPSSTSFEHEFLSWCLDQSIYRVFPIRLTEISILLNSALLFLEYDISLVIPRNLKSVNQLKPGETQQSKIAVFEDEMLIGGELPTVPDTITPASGVYTWHEISNQVKYRLLTV